MRIAQFFYVSVVCFHVQSLWVRIQDVFIRRRSGGEV